MGTIEYRNLGLSIIKIAEAEMMLGYFMLCFSGKKTGICFEKKKTKKHMSHGMAVEEPWEYVEMLWKHVQKHGKV